LIRMLDLNDYVNTKSGQIGGHPSDNIPVALAAGGLTGPPGRNVIAWLVLGYEIYGRFKELMDRDGDWDGVTVSGFVAPAIAGRLMGLDLRQLANALGLLGTPRALLCPRHCRTADGARPSPACECARALGRARDHAACSPPRRHFRCQERRQ